MAMDPAWMAVDNVDRRTGLSKEDFIAQYVSTYGNFDIVLAPFLAHVSSICHHTHTFKLYATTHAPCAMS